MTGPGRYREAGRLLTDTEEHPDAETASTASGAAPRRAWPGARQQGSRRRCHHGGKDRKPRQDGDRSMTDYEHVPCPACQGRGRIPVEEAAKIAGVSLEEAKRAAREAEKQNADDLEQRIAEAAARRGSLEGT